MSEKPILNTILTDKAIRAKVRFGFNWATIYLFMMLVGIAGVVLVGYMVVTIERLPTLMAFAGTVGCFGIIIYSYIARRHIISLYGRLDDVQYHALMSWANEHKQSKEAVDDIFAVRNYVIRAEYQKIRKVFKKYIVGKGFNFSQTLEFSRRYPR